MSDTINKRLTAIGTRCAVATERPWQHGSNTLFGGTWVHRRGVDPHAADGHAVADMVLRDEDAEFIAAARADVPDLLAIVGALPRCRHCDAFALYGTDDDRPLSCDACLPYYARVMAGRTLHELPYATALRSLGGRP